MLLARIRRIFKDPEIQSAESAPKDGTWILGFFEEYEPIEVRYSEGNWWTLYDGSIREPDGWKSGPLWNIRKDEQHGRN